MNSNSDKTKALLEQTNERAALVAYTQSTTYSSSSDPVSAKVLSVLRKMWLIDKWGYTDWKSASDDFATIAGMSSVVQKGYGTTLQATQNDLWKASYSSTKKDEIMLKLYWYKQ